MGGRRGREGGNVLLFDFLVAAGFYGKFVLFVCLPKRQTLKSILI